MIAKSITSAPFGGRITASPRRTGLTAVFFKITKQLFLLLLIPGLLLSAARATPSPGATITLNGGQTVNVFSSDNFTVTFTTAQTGLSASNFTVTGTVTGAFVSSVTGSGTTWTVTVSIPGSFQSQGTFTLNLANSTNLSPGLSGLPIAGPTVQVIAYPVDGTFNLSSTNANSGYAKTGDKINFTLQSAHYEVENWAVHVAGQNASGGANFSTVATGQVTLGSGTAQGALAWSWNYTNQFNESNNGSGTSGIIFDSVNPTISIGSPSVSSISDGAGSVTYSVTYADANFNTSTLTTSNITLNATGTASGIIGLTENSSTNYTVTISGITGAGTLGVSIASGTASDNAGNLAPASGASTTFIVVQPVATTTSISSDNNPSFSATPGNSVTFTATVLSGINEVNEGTVTFTSNGAPIGVGNVAVSNGQAALTTNFTAAGAYTILASYNGTTNFSTSSQSLNQQVNLHPTTINSITANSAYSNAGTIQFTVTFGASVSGLSTANFSLAATGGISGAAVASVSPSSGATYTVTVNTGTGDGTIGLNFFDASGLTPGISTSLPFTGGTTVIDKTPPLVIIGAPSATITNTGPVTFDVSFSDANFNNTTFSGTNVIVNSTGTANYAQVTSVQNSATDFTVSVDGITGDGTLSISAQAGTSQDLAGNTDAGAGPSATFTADNTAPNMSSITAATPGNTNPTNATSVSYTVTFSKVVTGVSGAAFTATATNTVASTGIVVTPVSSSVYTVTVSGISGDGTLRLDLNSSGTGITDLAGNAISGGFTGGDVYNIHQTPPVTTIINYTSTSSAPAGWANSVGDVLIATVSFDEMVQTPVITIGGHTAAVVNTTGNTWTGSYTLTVNDPEGNYVFDVKATDMAGNASEYNSGIFGYLITFDKTPPAVTISDPSATVTHGGPVTYTINFSDTNFKSGAVGAGQITLNVTGSATANVGVDNFGVGATVTLSNITGDGLLGISVYPGTAVDQANNRDIGAGPSATFIVDNTPPKATISAPSVTQIGNGGAGTVSYSVTYADANFSTSNLTNAGITLSTTGSAAGTYNVTGAGTSYTVTISGITGLGTLGINLAGGYASDLAGNPDLGAGPSTPFNVVSSDATLSGLGVSTGSLNPTFNSGVTAYADSVGHTITSINVTPATNDPGATAVTTINGNTGATGALNIGDNAVVVKVTAADGVTTQTYTIRVGREGSHAAGLANLSVSGASISPSFATTTTSYTANVTNSTQSVTITPSVSDLTSTVTVNNALVSNKTASGAITLNVGSNIIPVVVTAQDGVTKRSYTLNVIRAGNNDAYLASMSLSNGAALSPAFAFKTLNYTASVPNRVSSVTLTANVLDPNAAFTVNTLAATPKVASAPIQLTAGAKTIITIVVKAQNNSTTQTYTVTVTRAPGAVNTVYQPVGVGRPDANPALAEDGITVHQGVSPNGDGINDFLQIDNISQYPDNKLAIMNRNGQLIYEASGYDNSSKAFDGHSNKNGKMQLPGTYFYQLDYTISGITKHKTGFIVLKY